MNYRLYTFVAGLYLSELQKGLQTAHIVGELMAAYRPGFNDAGDAAYEWAANDKTIIILNALNHGGVVAARDNMRLLAEELNLPSAIFYEDEMSMNRMATAFGVVVPEALYDVTPMRDLDGEVVGYRHVPLDATLSTIYHMDTAQGQFCHQLKSYRMA